MKNRRFLRALLLLALAVLLLPLSAGAEVVGRTADGFIHRYVADNGQEIYFVSNMEEALVETDADVNFDGHPDLAVVTAMGASNAYYEFYLWNGSEYEYAERWTGDIVNYWLQGGKYLVSRSNDGSAGMLFHSQICVWDGNTLKAVRTMTAEEETLTEWDDDMMITAVHFDRLHVTLRGSGEAGEEPEILWEKTYDPFPEDAAVFDEMEARLWEGLPE